MTLWWTLHRGEPEGAGRVLTTWERAYLATLPAPSRRRDFVHGRWVAKHLLQGHLDGAFTQSVALEAIEVERDNDGVPRAHVRVPWLVDPAFSLSISHRGDAVMAASVSGRDVAVGADVEIIEPRSRALVQDFFVAEEVAAVDRAADPDVVANTIWSAKEAVLKALHLGLSVDTRRVRCDVPVATATWQEIGIVCDVEGASHPRCWCLRRDDLVLTLAVATPARVEMHEYIMQTPVTPVVRSPGEIYA